MLSLKTKCETFLHVAPAMSMQRRKKTRRKQITGIFFIFDSLYFNKTFWQSSLHSILQMIHYQHKKESSLFDSGYLDSIAVSLFVDILIEFHDKIQITTLILSDGFLHLVLRIFASFVHAPFAVCTFNYLNSKGNGFDSYHYAPLWCTLSTASQM